MSENLNPIVLEVEEVRVVNAVSPTVDLGRTETGALVTVHDYRGTQTVEILDGLVGPVGPQGPQGESGAETAKAIVEEAISRMEDSIHDAQMIGQTVAGYRDAAAQSASNAALSKDAAALSAQAAEQSNQSSSGYARTAGEQAENAAQSAQASSQSATAADTSARNAAQSETNAGNFAQSASQSAQAASQSASNAATSEQNAADSAQDAHDVLDSIPEDYSTLSSDVTNLKSALSDVEAGYTPLGKLIPNSYISTIGEVVPYNGWSATDYIPINDSERRLIITTPNSNGGNYDAFYNESKTFIAGSAFGLSKGENLIVVPENAKYVRLSNVTADLQQTTIKWWIANAAEIGSNAAFVYTTTGEDCVNASIDINGNAINADNWKATPYICVPFSNGGTIKVKSTINGNAGIAFYDKNQRCIYAITGNNASDYGITQNAYPVSRTIQVPANTFYIRFAVHLDGYGTVSDLYASDYGMNQLLFAIGEDNQSIMHFNEGVLPTVNASANYGYHKGGYYNTDTRFCLLVTTDPHGQKIQLERAVDYLNRMPCFTCGVTLGDIQAANFADNDGTWYTDVIKNANKNWLTIVGNHDAGHNNDPSLVGTPEAVYQKFIEPNMQYADTTDTGKSYYYKDVDNYKIRLICLNDYDYTNNEIVNGVYVVPRYTEYFSQNQIDWLISTLSSTPAEYTVLVLLHNCPGRATKNTNIKFNNSVATWYYESTQNGIITDVVDAWQNGSTLAQTYICTNTNLPNVTVSADFTSRGSGLFAGFLCGHAHADNVGTIVAHPAQNVFTFSATAKGYYQNSDDDLPRQDGTKAADCITAFAIDTVHKNVLITRIGSDVSNILAKREPSVISYS